MTGEYQPTCLHISCITSALMTLFNDICHKGFVKNTSIARDQRRFIIFLLYKIHQSMNICFYILFAKNTLNVNVFVNVYFLDELALIYEHVGEKYCVLIVWILKSNHWFKFWLKTHTFLYKGIVSRFLKLSHMCCISLEIPLDLSILSN